MALVTVLWTVDTLTKFSQLRFLGYTPDSFRLITEQVTSAIVVLLLVPCRDFLVRNTPAKLEEQLAPGVSVFRVN